MEAASSGIRTATCITAEAALAAAMAAVRHGRTRGARVVAATTGADGELLALWRDDGAFAPSLTIAADKAYTAAAFMCSTDELAAGLASNDLVLEGIAARPRVILFGGGFPVRHEGRVVGAVGVSGGSEEDDRACALAAIAALGFE